MAGRSRGLLKPAGLAGLFYGIAIAARHVSATYNIILTILYIVQYNNREGGVYMEDERDVMASLALELRRGTLVLSVLSQLRESRYGYALVQKLESCGVPIDPSTLYPLLRRLEKQGRLASVWDTSDSKPRKYYRRTPYGDAVYEQLRAQWRQMAAELDRLLEEETP